MKDYGMSLKATESDSYIWGAWGTALELTEVC